MELTPRQHLRVWLVELAVVEVAYLMSSDGEHQSTTSVLQEAKAAAGSKRAMRSSTEGEAGSGSRTGVCCRGF